MANDIRATVEFPRTVCPISARSRDAPTPTDGVSTRTHSAGTRDVVEFSTDAADAHHAAIESMHSDDQTGRNRPERGERPDCPCAVLGELGCPLQRYTARKDTLTLVFEASDYEQVRRALGVLRDRFPDTNVTRLLRAPTQG